MGGVGLAFETSLQPSGCEANGAPSGQDRLHHVAMDIRQAEIAALEAVGQPFVVETQQVQDRRLEVVDVDLVLDPGEAHLVGLAEREPTLHPATGQHDAEAVGIVVAPEDGAARGAAFAEGRAAKLAAPDDEGVVEQAALLEVLDQGRRGLVRLRHLLGEAIADVFGGIRAVEVPAPVEEVDEADALLNEATCEQAVVGEAGFAGLGAIVSQTAARCGKQAELVLDGGHIMFDREVVDGLRDPLLHIVRNALSHGIEVPADRQQLGKAEAGTIHVSASLVGDHLVLAISDDGTGLDEAALRAAGQANGMIGLPIEAILQSPGISTAQEVTALSGRGVGLDAVAQRLNLLGGAVSYDSTVGQGLTVTLSAPSRRKAAHAA